ncbi:hypothetical protein [Seohaeicola zhoushanensis]|uniref:hypothetical protein n=1 Tax=Seohaeicola zhoushanensis TaxID=1569283 RepID=UPI0016797F82|nr:hypothetical protein [Seohaeicola zhoushanensis]
MTMKLLIMFGAALFSLYAFRYFESLPAAEATREEIISLAIGYFIEHETSVALRKNSDGEYVKVYHKTYGSVSEFRKEFPNCCHFSERSSNGLPGTARERRIKHYAGTVKIRYTQKSFWAKPAATESDTREVEIPMNRFGEVVIFSE